jgi:hypothetical protein
MKYFQLFGLIACAVIFVSCETTQTAGQGNQEQKRAAVLQQQEQEAAQMDPADRNLWDVQSDRMNRDTNPAIRY